MDLDGVGEFRVALDGQIVKQGVQACFLLAREGRVENEQRWDPVSHGRRFACIFRFVFLNIEGLRRDDLGQRDRALLEGAVLNSLPGRVQPRKDRHQNREQAEADDLLALRPRNAATVFRHPTG